MPTALPLLLSAFSFAALQEAQAGAPTQEPTPQEAYESWWKGIAAQPLPALQTGFVVEGLAVSPGEEADIFRMRVEGELYYLDPTHVRMDGTLSASADDGTRASGRFTLFVDAQRMYLSGDFRAVNADGSADGEVEGAASVSTAKLKDASRAVQETYRSLGMQALGYGESLLEREIGEWFHPALMTRATMEQLRVTAFTLGEDTAAGVLAIDIEGFRAAMDSALRMSGVDEDPELKREFDAEMQPMLDWLAELSFEMAMDRETGLPRPFSASLSMPPLMLGEGAPPVTLTASSRLVEPRLSPEFADGLFLPPTDVAWFDLDPFVDMALGAMQAMLAEAEAELDAEF